MRIRILKFVKWLLLIWGGFSLAASIVLGIYLVYHFKVTSHDRNDSASPQDVRYVLEGCHFGSKKIEQVVHSHISSRGFTGEYLDAFSIKTSPVEETDFAPKQKTPNEHWFRGDQLPPVLDAALELVTKWHNDIPWFPTGAELKSSDIYVYPVDFYACCGNVEPTMARQVFVRKTDNMVFYFDYKP